LPSRSAPAVLGEVASAGTIVVDTAPTRDDAAVSERRMTTAQTRSSRPTRHRCPPDGHICGDALWS
jgi:hypothetical protein